jgi:hypothetical protein
VLVGFCRILEVHTTPRSQISPSLPRINLIKPKNYIPPSQYNVVLTNINHNDLVGDISQRLDVTYLSQAEDAGELKSVVGILYGPNARPLINLVISSKLHKIPINVIFLIDTACPPLYVCDLAMKALGFTDNKPDTFDLWFGGSTHAAVMSPLEVDGKEGHQYHWRHLSRQNASESHC